MQGVATTDTPQLNGQSTADQRGCGLTICIDTQQRHDRWTLTERTFASFFRGSRHLKKPLLAYLPTYLLSTRGMESNLPIMLTDNWVLNSTLYDYLPILF